MINQLGLSSIPTVSPFSGNLSPPWLSAGQEKLHGAIVPPPGCHLVQDTWRYAGIHSNIGSFLVVSFCFDTDSSQRRQPALVVLGGEVRKEEKCHYLISNNSPSLRCCFSVAPSSPPGTSTTPQVTLGGRVGPTARCKPPQQSSHFTILPGRTAGRCSCRAERFSLLVRWRVFGVQVHILLRSGLPSLEVVTTNKMDKTWDRGITLC